MRKKKLYKVNTKDAIADLKKFGENVGKLIPTFIARLSFKGERIIKGEVPVRTGTLKRGMHAYPTLRPHVIATTVRYAFITNIRSSRPKYIEKTISTIEDIIPEEADKIIEQAARNL